MAAARTVKRAVGWLRGRWHVTLGGFLGDHAPAEEEGVLAFARSLPTSDIYEVIKDADFVRVATACFSQRDGLFRLGAR